MSSRTSLLPGSSTGKDVDSEIGTPTRPLVGPSRRLGESKTQRLSLNKPYARSSLGPSSKMGTAASPASSGHTITPNRHSQSRFGSDHSPSSAKKSQGRLTGTNDSPNKGGLLSGLREAIFSRPLSWLQRGSARSDTLPTSRSSSSIPSVGRKSDSFQGNDIQTLTRSNTFSSNEFGVTSNTSSRPSAFVAPPPSTPARSPHISSTVGYPTRSSQFGITTNNSISARNTQLEDHRSPSPARSSASAIIRSHGRQRLSMEPSNSPRYLTAGYSTVTGVSSGASLIGTPGYRRTGSQRGDGSVVSGGSASQAHSSASFAYGYGSERRLGGLTSSASLHGGPGQSPLASTSYNRLPSRSPFAMQRRSLGGSAAGSETGAWLGRASPSTARYGTGMVTTPLRPVSMFGGEGYGSRSGSVARSGASSRGNTAKRREWSSLKLAPPSAGQSAGEELMQEYLSMRDALKDGKEGEMQSVIHPALNDSKTSDEMVMSNDLDPVLGLSSRNNALKRDASMSIDGDAAMSDVQPRKRQMVWDPELGFVSRQEQRAARPPRPVANNEAERLLNALEGMRTPLGDARRDTNARSTTTPSRRTVNIPVPLPVPSSDSTGSRTIAGRNNGGEYLRAISPYGRAMRKQKALRAEEPASVGLRSRLRKEYPAVKSDVDAMSMGSGDQSEEEDESDGKEEEDEEEGDEEEQDNEDEMDDEMVEEPPRKRQPVNGNRKKTFEENFTKSKKNDDTSPASPENARVLRSGRVLSQLSSSPKKPEESRQVNHIDESPSNKEKSTPMSRARLGFSASGTSAANKQKVERQNPFSSLGSKGTAQTNVKMKDNFSVKTDEGGNSSTDSESRARSSLRHGAEKTSRTHVRSGRVGMDNDEDDDAMEDSPSAEELSKIKLPTNLFPQGFTFSSTPSASSSMSNSPKVKPVESSGDVKPLSESKKAAAVSGNEGETEGGASLLSRMGGFAAPVADQSVANSSLSSPSPPTFSLSSPSSTKPAPLPVTSVSASKPLFSFQPAVSSPLAGGNGSFNANTNSSFSSTSATSSNFFTPPTADEKKKLTEEKKDKSAGSIPNFFASSLAKSSSATPELSKAASAPSPFSFGPPSSSSSTNADTSKSVSFSFEKSAESAKTNGTAAPPAFSFGSAPKPDQASTASTSTSPFSFGAPASTSAASSSPSFSGFGAPASNEASKADSKPKVSFAGLPSSNPTNASTAPTFSFGTPSASASTAGGEDAARKRGFEEEKGDEEPQQKRGFTGFGAPSSSATTPANTMGNTASKPFSFNAPGSAAEEKKPAAAFSFGAPSQGEQNTNKPALNFGFGSQNNTAATPSSTPATTNAGTGGFGGFGGASNTSSASLPAKPAFSFGQPAPTGASGTGTTSLPAAPPTSNPSGGFSFGAKTDGNAGTTQANPATSSSTPFTFGQQAVNNAPSSPFGQPSGTPFGSNENSRQASPAPFTFGAPSGQQTTSGTNTGTVGFGGFGQQSTNTANPSSSTATSSFNFGAAAPTPSQPTAGSNGMSFSFSVPMSNTNSSGGMPAFGGGANQPMNGSGNPGGSPAFVFGATNSAQASGPSTPNGVAGGFSFGAAGSSAPPAAAAAAAANANSLFNIGGPSSASASGGNRPVRGMPSRRKKA